MKEFLKDQENDSFLLFALAKEYDLQQNYEKSIEIFEKLRELDRLLAEKKGNRT